MTLTVTNDHAAITEVIDGYLAADPVRGTILGTIRGSLEDDAWAAVGGNRLALRSGSPYPVVVMGVWTDEQASELAGLLRELPAVRGISGSPDLVATLLALGRLGTPPSMGQRLFRCDDVVAPAGVVGSAVAADESRRSLVQDWYVAFVAEAGDPFGDPRKSADRAMATGTVWIWLDDSGEPVSLAAQRSVVGGSARVGPVFTPRERRGHGFGSAVTAVATQAILDAGAIPVLFTDLANPTSNKIYQQIGYTPVEDRVVVAF